MTIHRSGSPSGQRGPTSNERVQIRIYIHRDDVQSGLLYLSRKRNVSTRAPSPKGPRKVSFSEIMQLFSLIYLI